LSTSGIPLLNHDGTLRGYHGSDTDITEKRQREVREIYSQKLESVGQLASGIAHELSTPLQFIGDNITFMQGAFQDILSIITMLDVLPDIDSPQLPSAHELIDRIHKKGEDVDLAYLKKEIPKAIVQSLDGLQRASKIVQAMREFSHPGGEGMVDLDINKSIESTITLSRNEWKYSAELIATLAPDLPTVQGYPADFNQAILNIILNAAQALQEKVGKGGPEKERIEIATRKDGNEVEICIRDTGPGIPQEIQSRVFDPFFTTKDVGKGTGQGLAIAHNIIVHKHGGKIYFETKLEEGTAFYIRLPLKTI
ncbi:MAG: ATP-binding protein, partial [Deltaproteobacteria bacterium]